MPMHKFKDVAHLYLGCKMVTTDSAENDGSWEELNFEKGDIGKLTLVNTGNAQIQCSYTDYYPYVVEFESGEYICIHDFQIVKPALRRWDDLTETEARVIYDIEEDVSLVKIFPSSITVSLVLYTGVFRYLLSLGFDLFNLIDSGQAIDIKTLKNEKAN